MDDKSSVLAVVSILGLVAALIFVTALSKPAQPVVNVYSDNSTKVIKYTTGLTATGNAEQVVDPDKVVVYLEVVTENNTAESTKDQNTELSNKVIAALKKSGVGSQDIETGGYYLKKTEVYNGYDILEEKENVTANYQMMQTLRVTATGSRDASANLGEVVGRIVDVAVDAGANGVNSVSFCLTDQTEKDVKETLLTEAIEDGKKRAGKIAANLGLKIGKITSVQETNYYGAYTSSCENNYPYYAGYTAFESSTLVSPQKVTIQSSVNIEFEIN
jgi:uncharacterized protein YggE